MMNGPVCHLWLLLFGSACPFLCKPVCLWWCEWFFKIFWLFLYIPCYWCCLDSAVAWWCLCRYLVHQEVEQDRIPGRFFQKEQPFRYVESPVCLCVGWPVCQCWPVCSCRHVCRCWPVCRCRPVCRFWPVRRCWPVSRCCLSMATMYDFAVVGPVCRYWSVWTLKVDDPMAFGHFRCYWLLGWDPRGLVFCICIAGPKIQVGWHSAREFQLKYNYIAERSTYGDQLGRSGFRDSMLQQRRNLCFSSRFASSSLWCWLRVWMPRFFFLAFLSPSGMPGVFCKCVPVRSICENQEIHYGTTYTKTCLHALKGRTAEPQPITRRWKNDGRLLPPWAKINTLTRFLTSAVPITAIQINKVYYFWKRISTPTRKKQSIKKEIKRNNMQSIISRIKKHIFENYIRIFVKGHFWANFCKVQYLSTGLTPFDPAGIG
ncbi:hypothetical protein ABFS83_07G108200 [Erythranthe nasuta]